MHLIAGLLTLEFILASGQINYHYKFSAFHSFPCLVVTHYLRRCRSYLRCVHFNQMAIRG